MDSQEPRTDLNDRSGEESYSAEGPTSTPESTQGHESTESDKFISSREAFAKPNETPKVTPAKTNRFGAVFSKFHFPAAGDSKLVSWLRRYWYIILAIIIILALLLAWRLYQDHVNAQWSKATDDYGRADYQDAAKILDGMPMPSDPQRLTVYSQTMLATRQLDKALTGYQALYDAKKDPSVKLIIGNIYNEQKKYDDAAKAYSDLIAANSGYVQAYVNLATLDKLQGKTDDAVATAKQGVKANPNSATMYELLISMLLEHPDSADYQQAVASLKKLNPQDPIFQTIQQ